MYFSLININTKLETPRGETGKSEENATMNLISRDLFSKSICLSIIYVIIIRLSQNNQEHCCIDYGNFCTF